MAKSLTIKNKSGDTLYPKTVSELVYNDSQGTTVKLALDTKQDTLVSGINIKTVNNTSLLGDGDVTIEGKSAYQVAVDNGFVGTLQNWLESLKGEQGDAGNVTVTDGVAEITIVNNLEDGGSGDALSAEMGKQLNNRVGKINRSLEIDLTPYMGEEANPTGASYINTSNKWVTTYIGVFIPVLVGTIVEITGNATLTTSYAFLKSSIAGSNNASVTTYATGAARSTVAAGLKVTEIVPNDAGYLWISKTVTEVDDRLPLSIKVVDEELAYAANFETLILDLTKEIEGKVKIREGVVLFKNLSSFATTTANFIFFAPRSGKYVVNFHINEGFVIKYTTSKKPIFSCRLRKPNVGVVDGYDYSYSKKADELSNTRSLTFDPNLLDYTWEFNLVENDQLMILDRLQGSGTFEVYLATDNTSLNSIVTQLGSHNIVTQQTFTAVSTFGMAEGVEICEVPLTGRYRISLKMDLGWTSTAAFSSASHTTAFSFRIYNGIYGSGGTLVNARSYMLLDYTDANNNHYFEFNAHLTWEVDLKLGYVIYTISRIEGTGTITVELLEDVCTRIQKLNSETLKVDDVDEVPTKNSLNVVQSGGIFNEFDSIRKNIEQTHTVHTRLIDMQKYYTSQSSRYINMTNNRWQDSGTTKAFLMTIKPNTKYIIHGNATGTSRYALLTDNDQTLNATPNYATGETLNTLTLGEDKEFVTPADAHYMSVNWLLDSNTVVPRSIEEEYSVSECIDETIKQNHDIVLYDLAQRYMVDGRIDSSTFGEVIFCLSAENGNADWGCSLLIDLLGATHVRYYTSVASTSSNFYNVTGTVYYDANKNPMQEGLRLIQNDNAKYTWVDEDVPTGARYMRVSCRWSWNQDPNHYVRLYKIKTDDVYGLDSQTLLNGIKDRENLVLIKNARYGFKEGDTQSAVTTDVNDGTVSFLHFSDIHSDRKAAEAIRAIYDKYSTYITDMLSTGDVVYYNHTDDFTFYTDNNLTDALFALGNHDGHSSGNWNSLGELATYEKYFAPYISGWNVVLPDNAAENYLMYYYKDYTPANVRLIVLDGLHLTAAQLLWFTDTLALANTLSYTVVVASHYIPALFGEEDLVKKPDGEVVSFHHRAVTGRDTIDAAFRLSVNYANAVQTFINNGGKFAIWLCGHYHTDYFTYTTDYPGVLFSAIDQAGYRRGGINASRSIGDPCANLVVIHPRSSLIKIIRFGLNYDRYLRLINVLTYQYSSHKVFTNY